MPISSQKDQSASALKGYDIAAISSDEEFRQAADLWHFCFGLDSLAEKDDLLAYAKNHTTHLFGVFWHKKVVGTLSVIMFQMKVNGVFVPCAGIASVATDPAHRHRGLVKAMMVHALKKMHDANVPVTSLYPFSFPYYERMGYAASNLTYKIKVPASWLHQVASLGDCRNYALTPLDQHQQAAELHERALARWNTTLRRAPDRWLVRLYQFGAKWRMLCHVDGYMLINTRQGKDHDARTINVGEWNYLTNEAFLDGLAVLGGMASQADWVQWVDGDIAAVMALGVSDPKPSFEVMPTMMSRVLNLEAFEQSFGKTNQQIHDPLGITAPAAATANLKTSVPGERHATTRSISPGQLFQQVNGFHCAPIEDDGARSFLASPAKSLFGPNFCNDYF